MILYTGFRVHGRSCQWLTSCYTKKQYQKAPLWAGNEPGCSACSGHCSEKHSFGYFLYQTFLTSIKLSFRYCKVPVKMVSECWAVAWKWWVIKLLGKIFWQESVRRVDSILGIIFSSSVICIASPVQALEGSHCPRPQVGQLLAGRTGLAVPPRRQEQQQPQSLAHLLGTPGHALHTQGCPRPNSSCPWALLALGVQGGFLFLERWCFPCRGLSRLSLWRGPTAPYT